jgi:hypothetical protein
LQVNKLRRPLDRVGQRPVDPLGIRQHRDPVAPTGRQPAGGGRGLGDQRVFRGRLLDRAGFAGIVEAVGKVCIDLSPSAVGLAPNARFTEDHVGQRADQGQQHHRQDPRHHRRGLLAPQQDMKRKADCHPQVAEHQECNDHATASSARRPGAFAGTEPR